MDSMLHDTTLAMALEVLDNAPFDIWWIDENHQIAKANKTALEHAKNIDVTLVGGHVQELDPSFSTELLASFFSGNEKQKKYSRIRTVADGTLESSEELLLLQKTGQGRLVVRYGKDILDGAGKACKRDCLPATVENTRKIHNEFIANMNHDLRTPMNAIIGYAEMLAGCVLPDREKRFADAIYRSGMTLVTILNDLMDLSKIESGRLKLKKVPVRLEELVDEVVDLFRDQAQLKKLDLMALIDKDTPPVVFIDGIRLKQVMQNILSNAIKFTSKGSISIAIGGEWAGGNHSNIYNLHVVIADTGIGISQKDSTILSQILNPVGEEAVTSYNGRGFGLALCGRLVAMMGGDIVLESISGAGTTVTVTLTDVSMANTQYHSSKQAIAVPAQCSMNVSTLLIVDDEELIKEVFVDYFSGSAMQVVKASTGEEALEAAMQHKPAVVFMDLHLSGGKDGRAVTRELRNNPVTAHIPVIVMTGELLEHTDLEQLFDGYLQKPFRFEEVEKIITQFSPMVTVKEGEQDTVAAAANDNRKATLLQLSSIWNDGLEVQLEKAIFTGSLSNAVKLGELIKIQGKARGLEAVVDFGTELILCATEHDIIGVDNLLTQLDKNDN